MNKQYNTSDADATALGKEPFETSVEFTLIEAQTPLTKRFKIDECGKVAQDAQRPPSSGLMSRERLTGTAYGILKDFAEKVCALDRNEAVICGSLPAGRDAWQLCLQNDEDPTSGRIARSKKHIAPVAGPALLYLDFDIKDYPPDIAARIDEKGGLGKLLASVFPGFETAAVLRRPSVSSFVGRNGSDEPVVSKGEHRYYVVKDGTDAKTFAKRLLQHLQLAGWAWGKVNGAGTISVLGPIDAGASEPSRLCFEADAELGAGLEYLQKRTAEVSDGGMLDTAALPELSVQQHGDLDAVLERVRNDPELRAVSESRLKVRQDERKERLAERGLSEGEIEKSLNFFDLDALEHDEEIHLDTGEVVTVNDILRDQAAYHGKTCAMPLEPDYGSGRNMAIIYMRPVPVIHAQGHGGVKFRLLEDPKRFFEIERPEDNDQSAPRELTEPKKSQDAFECLTIDDIMKMKPPRFLVDRHIPSEGIGFVYGEPSGGKSFLVLDLALHIAYGASAWHGDRITPRAGKVLFIAGEGVAGMVNRIEAWTQATIRPVNPDPGFRLIRQSMNFMLGEDIERLHRTVDLHAEEGLDLIVVDTASQVLPGADENLQKDMTKFMQACKHLRDKHRCAVLIVHHTAKHSNGMRGSSVFLANADYAFEVARKTDGGLVELACRKQKDAPDDWAEAYRLKMIEWANSGGEQQSSMYVERLAKVEVAEAEIKNRQAIAEIVAQVMEDRETALWGEIADEISLHANPKGALRPRSKLSELCKQAADAVSGEGVQLERSGHSVLVRAEKTGTAQNSPWRFSCSKVEQGARDAV